MTGVKFPCSKTGGFAHFVHLRRGQNIVDDLERQTDLNQICRWLRFESHSPIYKAPALQRLRLIPVFRNTVIALSIPTNELNWSDLD